METLLKMAAQMFMSKLGANGLDLNTVVGALQGLLPTQGGEVDMTSLLARFAGQGGLQALAQTWLGDGANAAISADQVRNVFGQEATQNFAQKLGVSAPTALDGLAKMLPELIDKTSSAGTFKQDMVGSLGKQLLGGLFK